jgi:hypothetical protein
MTFIRFNEKIFLIILIKYEGGEGGKKKMKIFYKKLIY